MTGFAKTQKKSRAKKRMSQEEEPMSALATWEAQNLRLTGFQSPGPKGPTNVWEDLVGMPPDKSTSEPKRGIFQEEGAFEDRKLTLKIQPFRIDWVLQPLDKELKEIPSIGKFSEAVESFSQLMLRWLGKSPPIQRLAFGAVLHQSVESKAAGYEQLSKYLMNVQLDPEGSSDFFYQINRPRTALSGVSNLRINRLSKWLVPMLQQADLSIQEKSVKSFFASRAFVCQLEIDINTTAAFEGELPHEKLPAIFQELVSLGKEIALKGDIA